MTHISIRERTGETDTPGTRAALVFDGGEKYPISISDPFTEQEEERLEWYFEQHLRFPSRMFPSIRERLRNARRRVCEGRWGECLADARDVLVNARCNADLEVRCTCWKSGGETTCQ
jgi:hypothetical protein